MVSQSIEIKASPKQCFDVITDYKNYEKFIKDLKSVTVTNKKGGDCDVTYEIDVIKRISYSLHMMATPPNKVEWSFICGDVMKENQGFWELEEIKKGLTRATYNIEVKFGLLVPSIITKALVGSNLPAMLKSFKERIESKSKG
jgi:ribosome-associated toxin RatA of RatAB toxin-antitoxin module